MNTQKPELVLVISSKALLNVFKNKIEKIWPDHSIYFVINHAAFGLYKFDYPVDNSLLSFPYIAEPSWKYYGEDIGKVWHVENEVAIETDYSTLAILKSAETIALISTMYASEVVSFQILLELTLGKINGKSYLLYSFDSITNDALTTALNNPLTTDHITFQNRLRQGVAKRFFEFNFNFNSCLLFKPVLQKAGIRDHNFVLTKYVLQLLLALQDCVYFSEHDMVVMMDKYGMGMPYSYALMFENLKKPGIIEQIVKDTKKNKHYYLSENGKTLLKLINPDCADIDLAVKIESWMDNWPESKKEMEDYLVQFFRKQMEFNG